MIKKLNTAFTEELIFTKKERFWWWVKLQVQCLVPYQVRNFYFYHIKTIWAPQHTRIRKAIPRHWNDLDSVLQNVNFEIIKSFYEDEYKQGPVDWEGSGKEAVKFAKWLEASYEYVSSYRLVLEKQIENAYPNYRKVEKLEQEMEDMDTKILTELVKYRKHLWT